MHELFDPARHEALTVRAWRPDLARQAIERICVAAEDEFDEREGSWLLHPQDEPALAGARSLNLYWGATGAVWALRHLAHSEATELKRDYTRWIERYPDGMREEASDEQHGSASYLFGESSALLLACYKPGEATSRIACLRLYRAINTTPRTNRCGATRERSWPR